MPKLYTWHLGSIALARSLLQACLIHFHWAPALPRRNPHTAIEPLLSTDVAGPQPSLLSVIQQNIRKFPLKCTEDHRNFSNAVDIHWQPWNKFLVENKASRCFYQLWYSLIVGVIDCSLLPAYSIEHMHINNGLGKTCDPCAVWSCISAGADRCSLAYRFITTFLTSSLLFLLILLLQVFPANSSWSHVWSEHCSTHQWASCLMHGWWIVTVNLLCSHSYAWKRSMKLRQYASMHMASAYAIFVLPLGHNLEKSNRKGNSTSVVQVFLSRQACLCRTNIYIADCRMLSFVCVISGRYFCIHRWN